jgi:hypothetical protein
MVDIRIVVEIQIFTVKRLRNFRLATFLPLSAGGVSFSYEAVIASFSRQWRI